MIIDDDTQRAITGIREDLADVASRLTKLKESPAGIADYRYGFVLAGGAAMLDLVHENLGGFAVDAVISELLEGVDLPHPVSLLGQFRLSEKDIMAAVRVRLKRARGRNRAHLAELLEKLEYSRELRKGARQRQKRLRGR